MADYYQQISKGPVCGFLDELSRDEDAVKKLGSLAKDLAKLSGNYGRLTGVLGKHLFKSVDSKERKLITDYLRQKWFDPKKGWWGHLQPIAPVFGMGLQKAIEESISQAKGKNKAKKALPIDSYWIAVDDRMEVTVMRSPRQVTLLILTPRPPSSVKMGGIGSKDTNVWTIRREQVPNKSRKVKADKLTSRPRFKMMK